MNQLTINVFCIDVSSEVAASRTSSKHLRRKHAVLQYHLTKRTA